MAPTTLSTWLHSSNAAWYKQVSIHNLLAHNTIKLEHILIWLLSILLCVQSGEGSPNGLSANVLENSNSAGSPKRLEASQEQVNIQTIFFGFDLGKICVLLIQ